MKHISFALFIFMVTSCHIVRQDLKISVVREQLLDSMPSGSGAVYHNDSLIIIADDAPFIYELSLEDFHYRSVPLRGYTADSYRIPKPVKPDYECATAVTINNKPFLMALGSGSQSPTRDTMLLAPLDDLSQQRTIYISELYRSMMQQTNTPAEQWNIEGLAMAGDELLILNRGGNTVIAIKWSDMSVFINNGTMPKVSSYVLQLPSYKKRIGRISGACPLNDQGDMLFCASIEDTPDWHTDGPVLGSYIGIFSHKDQAIKSIAMLRDESGEPMLEKLESIELLHADEHNADVVTLADDDKGSTKVKALKLSW